MAKKTSKASKALPLTEARAAEIAECNQRSIQYALECGRLQRVPAYEGLGGKQHEKITRSSFDRWLRRRRGTRG